MHRDIQMFVCFSSTPLTIDLGATGPIAINVMGNPALNHGDTAKMGGNGWILSLFNNQPTSTFCMFEKSTPRTTLSIDVNNNNKKTSKNVVSTGNAKPVKTHLNTWMNCSWWTKLSLKKLTKKKTVHRRWMRLCFYVPNCLSSTLNTATQSTNPLVRIFFSSLKINKSILCWSYLIEYDSSGGRQCCDKSTFDRNIYHAAG